ncbi:MAG: isochorismate synthase [Acidimicrobiia bacterium]|nr:isochorismate synthase [Acidimicrobiia bacterium]
MLLSHDQLAQLRTQLSGDPDHLRTASIPVDCAPLAVVRAGARLFGHSTYFRSPEGEEMATLGVAQRLNTSGPDRFRTLEREMDLLPSAAARARLVVGFSFNPTGPAAAEWAGFGALDVVLPEIAVVGNHDGSELRVAVRAGSDVAGLLDTLAGLSAWDAPLPPDPGVHTVESVPATAEWQSEVAEAVGAIRGGSFQKVVLARSVQVESERATDPFDLVYHLRAANPAGYVYATMVGDSAFVGASPELLLARSGNDIKLNPLAGSARRGKGEDDVAVGEELLASAKNRAEHSMVVEDLVSRLGPLTEALTHSDGPSLRRMATVQHLSTEITASLLPGVSTCDVLASIHPTPAVGGTPRAEALAFIDKVEGLDRGWYSGGVGWITPSGEAVVALALRCALLNGRTSRLYAGNGIVAESDPAIELEETRLKFQPLLSLLAAT